MKRGLSIVVGLAMGAGLLAACAPEPPSIPPDVFPGPDDAWTVSSPPGHAATARVSLDESNFPTARRASSSSVSANARYVVFSTYLPWFGSGVRGHEQMYVRDLDSGSTSIVSVSSGGQPGNSPSYGPINDAISGGGRYVVFTSIATDLVPGKTSSFEDAFVHDRQTGRTSLVSAALNGSQGNGRSEVQAISVDGRFVVFVSAASNLVIGDTNDRTDLFVRDRQTGETSRVSVSSDSSEANGDSSNYAGIGASADISADGRFVAFVSDATNLVAGDTNEQRDVFVHDRQTGDTSRVTVASDGTQANFVAPPSGSIWIGLGAPAISADGRFVTFSSLSSNLVDDDANDSADTFVHDRQSGETTRVSVNSDSAEGDGHSYVSSISADGRYTCFASASTNLVPDDTNNANDVFVHDRLSSQTARVSTSSDGTQAEEGTGIVCGMDASGHFTIFSSTSGDLVGDSYPWSQIYMRSF